MSAKRNIDWEKVRSKLRADEAALEESLVADPQRLQAIYRRRAEKLASRRDRPETVVSLPVLIFRAGEERCGIDLKALAEVVPFSGCTPVPGAPPALLGVINRRGQIQPVADLASLLHLPGAERGAPGYVLWLRQQNRRAGLKVGRIERVQQIAPGALIIPEETGPGPSARYLRGLTPDRVRILDLEAILAHPLFKEVSQA